MERAIRPDSGENDEPAGTSQSGKQECNNQLTGKERWYDDEI